MFPIRGSMMLFGLYVVLMLVDKSLINVLLMVYFVLIALFVLTSMLIPIVETVLVPPSGGGKKITVPYPTFLIDFINEGEPLELEITAGSVVACLAAIATTCWCVALRVRAHPSLSHSR
jgi:hypothetical protein